VKQRRSPAFIAIAGVVTVTGFLVGRCWSTGDNYEYYAHKLSPSKPAYDFTLTNQDEKPYSLGKLRGKLVLMTFGFTHCPNICPTTLANLRAAYELLSPADQARVQVLFITIDPDRDTSKVLKDYVPFFEKRFVGLTGNSNQIAATAKAYGVEYERISQPGGESIEHSIDVNIIGPSGKWIAFYKKRQLSNSQRMADDLRHFLTVSSSSDDNWQSEKTGVIKAQAASGRQLYLEQCASCHLENGHGISGKYPSLVKSTWVLGAPNRLTALVLDGVTGNGDPDSGHYAGIMPAWRRVLTPADTAAVLTYIRQAWGNDASAISSSYVQRLSYQFGLRPDFWSWKELEALPPDSETESTNF